LAPSSGRHKLEQSALLLIEVAREELFEKRDHLLGHAVVEFLRPLKPVVASPATEDEDVRARKRWASRAGEPAELAETSVPVSERLSRHSGTPGKARASGEEGKQSSSLVGIRG
jgi:hypothetical protein